MEEGLAKTLGLASDGDRIEASSYPESESVFFKRTLGRDDLRPIHDGHAEKAILEYCYDAKRKEIVKLLQRIYSLNCENAPVEWPGRSAVVRQQITENLGEMEKPSWRSLRWNQHYQKAISTLKAEIGKANLKPLSLRAAAETGTIQKNLSKNAGYLAFETGKRSKGENLQEAVRRASLEEASALANGHFGHPLVVAIRTSNSGISDWDKGLWKERTRPILMVDLRQLLQSTRFCHPMMEWFKSNIPWGEGGMTHSEVELWTWHTRVKYSNWFSTDFSGFDRNQSDWLLEDVFSIFRAAFHDLSPYQERLWQTMVNSYIHKEIHSFDRVYYVHKGNTSGEAWTYLVNTMLHRLMQTTIMNMLNFTRYESLLCGDDGLTYYTGDFDLKRYCKLMSKFFGIKVSMEKSSYGTAKFDDPDFLSRTWTLSGATRPIQEVLFNLVFPERFRDYFGCGVSEEVAVTLLLYCAYVEQPQTIRQWFDVDRIKFVSGCKSMEDAYRKLARMGTGFNTSWLKWQFGSFLDDGEAIWQKSS